MRVRETTWRDIPTLAELDLVLFGPDAWPEPTWWAELAARPRRDYLVVLDDDAPATIVGYAGLDVLGEVADVMTLAVAPRMQGRGLGAGLVTELVARARARGAGSLMLEVRADNAPALALYAHHGFARVAVRRGYYEPGGVDALVLRRRVEAT